MDTLQEGATPEVGVLYRPGFFPSEACAGIIAAFRRFREGTNLGTRTPLRTEIAVSLFTMVGEVWVGTFLDQLQDEARQALCDRYQETRPLALEFAIVTEMLPGDGHARHADNVRSDGQGGWEPNHTPDRLYTAMLYLNTRSVEVPATAQSFPGVTGDYSGGEIRFPQLGVSFSPSVGDLVAFPSGARFEHEVPAIRSGSRFAVSMWYQKDPHGTPISVREV